MDRRLLCRLTTVQKFLILLVIGFVHFAFFSKAFHKQEVVKDDDLTIRRDDVGSVSKQLTSKESSEMKDPELPDTKLQRDESQEVTLTGAEENAEDELVVSGVSSEDNRAEEQFSDTIVHDSENYESFVVVRQKSRLVLDSQKLMSLQNLPVKKTSREHQFAVHSDGSADRTTDSDWANERRGCTPHINALFLKTHKTAGSTLQNIFYRFGDKMNLTFALPAHDVYIQSVKEFEVSSILPAAPGSGYNILANHARFFYNDFKTIMPRNTKYVTIIRKSSSQFKSMYEYFVMKSNLKASLEQYSLNPAFYYEKYGLRRYTRHNGRDPMLFDLGMDKGDLYDQGKVDQYIQFLDSRFDLVLITEYFLESLILLRELMCWDLETVVHVSNKVRVPLGETDATLSGTDPMEAENLAKRLDMWNKGDVKLYDHFNKTLWRRIDAFGRTRMASEVEKLKELSKRYESECMEGTKKRDISRGSMEEVAVQEYIVKPSQAKNMTCIKLSLTPKTFLSYLRRKHIRRFRRTAT